MYVPLDMVEFKVSTSVTVEAPVTVKLPEIPTEPVIDCVLDTELPNILDPLE